MQVAGPPSLRLLAFPVTVARRQTGVAEVTRLPRVVGSAPTHLASMGRHTLAAVLTNTCRMHMPTCLAMQSVSCVHHALSFEEVPVVGTDRILHGGWQCEP